MLKINNRKENKFYYDVIANVIDIKSYTIDKEAYVKILDSFTNYFVDNSNLLISYEDETGNIFALLGANIFKDYVDFELINEIYDNTTNDYIKMQKRIMDSLKSFKFNGPELVIFSSLQKGYGSKMISLLEKELISKNYNHYFLLTASDNTYEWYIKNGYELIEKKTIDFSDLDAINKYKTFETMLFKKTINNI